MDQWYTLPGFNQPMNSMTHLLGALVYLVLSYFLLRGAWWRRACFFNALLFSFAVVSLLSISGVYHMFSPEGTTALVMIRLDVAAIFFLIAATITPVHSLLFTGWKRWGMLIPIWVIAITGITLRTIFFNSIPYLVGTLIFLVMGWIGGLSGYLLLKSYGRRAFVLELLGGIMYTIGALGDAVAAPVLLPRIWGSHETFHLFVLAGIGFHWHLISQVTDGSFAFRESPGKH